MPLLEKMKQSGRRNEVAQDHLPEAFHMFEEHGLTLSVRADDKVMIGEREFDNGMKTGETSVTREHLFDKDA
jgi:hypothetical protein